MKKININALGAIITGIALVTMALCFSGCNSQKQLAKAVNKVLANPKALNEIGKVWEQKNPCTNDTISKSDTVINNVSSPIEKVYLPLLINTSKKIDTVFNGLKIVADSNGIFVSGSYDCKEITVKTTNNVTDNRRLNIARDSLNNYRDSFALYYANFETANDSIVQLNSKINLIQAKHEADIKNVTTTFKWFVAAFWHTFKWWFIVAAIGFLIGKFRVNIFSFISKFFIK